MDTEKVKKRLKQLQAVATLRAGEEKDEGRANEARNAAFLLLKTALDNGFTIQFYPPGMETTRVTARGFDYSGPDSSVFSSVMEDLFGGMARDLRQQKPAPTAKRIIKARYAGACGKCGKTYRKGARVVWSKESTPRHVECAT